MNILVTGSAGFIGFHLTRFLLKAGYEVTGIDSINDYYDPALKFDRLQDTGIDPSGIEWGKSVTSDRYPNYRFIRASLENKEQMEEIFSGRDFDIVVNLAAQAGVRYSITNPDSYIQSNLVGFFNILECCRHFKIRHLVYASSSSVYGLNESIPFEESQGTNHPVSLYAATKKSNELMAHAYSHLYQLPTTGLRFFTVYGPWGRPDMACFLFARAILDGKPIEVFNYGNMKRDFTYVDDVVNGIAQVIKNQPAPNPAWNASAPDPSISSAPYHIYNIGNNKPVKLMQLIRELEDNLGCEAKLDLKELQAGDVPATWASVDLLANDHRYLPVTGLKDGIRQFVAWFRSYYSLPTPSQSLALSI